MRAVAVATRDAWPFPHVTKPASLPQTTQWPMGPQLWTHLWRHQSMPRLSCHDRGCLRNSDAGRHQATEDETSGTTKRSARPGRVVHLRRERHVSLPPHGWEIFRIPGRWTVAQPGAISNPPALGPGHVHSGICKWLPRSHVCMVTRHVPVTTRPSSEPHAYAYPLRRTSPRIPSQAPVASLCVHVLVCHYHYGNIIMTLI